VGMSHRTAPVAPAAKATVGPDDVPKLLDEMLRAEHVSEVVLLATGNRIEAYAVVDAFHGGLTDVSGVLARHSGLPLADLTDHMYVHYAASAVQHLFAVSAGLDSMVVGESQILGQLRSAYAVADDAETAALADFTTRLVKAFAYLNDHRDQLADAVFVKQYGLTRERAQELVESGNGATEFLPLPGDIAGPQQKLADLFTAAGQIPDPLDVGPEFDSRFNDLVAAAQKETGS